MATSPSDLSLQSWTNLIATMLLAATNGVPIPSSNGGADKVMMRWGPSGLPYDVTSWFRSAGH
jgi:hypothetical protein